MVTNTILETSVEEERRQRKPAEYKITVFHCAKAVGYLSGLEDDYGMNTVLLPCSSLVREVVLLKAFEAGADAVIVMACPEGACRYLEGNARAGKRVARLKRLLDEIGLDGRRLNFYNVSPNDGEAVNSIIDDTLSDLSELGNSPAR